MGRVDPETKEIIPTRKRSGSKTKNDRSNSKDHRLFYGAIYLFEAIGKKLGIIEDLKKCFPDTYKQILSIAYYLILEDKNPLSRFPRWAATHKHPNEQNISSQRSSDLFASVTEEAKNQFFQLQGKRRLEKEYWAYDTTSISSYSKCIKQVRYGRNKDHEPLSQINLALLFGEESRLPFYYRKLTGNITDVKTIKRQLSDVDFLGFKKIKLVMDRGFYSKENIDNLYRQHLKFLIAGKLSLKFIQTTLNKIRDSIPVWSNYNEQYRVYAHPSTIKWNYSQDRPYKGDSLNEERRMYLHLYFSSERALEDEQNLNSLLSKLQNELLAGKRNPDHETQYAKYFETSTTPVRGTKVIPRNEIISEAKRNYGYFVLLSNDLKFPTPIRACLSTKTRLLDL